MKNLENTHPKMFDSKSVNPLSKKQMNKILGGKKDCEEVGIETAEGEGEEEEME